MRLVSRSQPCARHCHFPLLVTMLASNNDTIADERAQTTAVADAAVRDILVGDPVAVQWPAPDRRAPVLRATAHRRRYLFRSAVSLRRRPAASARCVATQGSARRAGPGADLCSRRRLGARQPHLAGVHADVASGRTGLGVLVDRLPRCAAAPMAAPHPGRQSRHRLGPGQHRSIRRRPRLRGACRRIRGRPSGLTGGPHP